MFRFPFGPRPTPGRTPQYRPEEKTLGYDDLARHASFSPELSFLLAMTLKDGLQRSAVLELLKNIEPYVNAGDREAIRGILGARQLTEEFRRTPHVLPPSRSGAGLTSFSRLARQQALLDVLQRYAGQDARRMMQQLQKSAGMQENFERMTRRMEKLRHMDASSPDQMFEALSMFMPPGEQSKYRNMQNMMRMMGSMKNFKPEDLFKFMGGQPPGRG